MATKAGGAYIEIRADNSKLKSDLDKAHGQVTSSANTMQSQVSKAFNTMSVAAVASFAAISYGLVSLSKDAALLAARFETMGIVMNQVGGNAGYSATQMNEYDKALRKTGISMIESRNSLTKMAQAQLDLSKATQLGRIAQDAAVIGQINSSEAFGRMIEGIQRGNTIILKSIGLNVDFEAGYKKVALATGRSTDSFSQAEKAIIRQNTVIEYGSRIAGVYEAAMDTAGKKLSSFTRYVEDFKVKMGAAFGPSMVIMIDAATLAMKQLQEEISKPETQLALTNISNDLADIVVTLSDDIPGKFKAINEALSGIWRVISYDPAIIEYGLVGLALGGKKGALLLGSIGHMVTWVQNLSAALGMASTGLISFSDIVNSNFKELEEIVNSMGDSLSSTEAATKRVSELSTELEILNAKINSGYGNAGYIDSLKEQRDAIKLKIIEQENLIQKTVDLGAAVEMVADKYFDFGGRGSEGLKEVIKETITLTEEQIKIQEDFVKAYKKSTMSTKDFELDMLKSQVEAYRSAKVDEIQLENWAQNQIKTIKLKAEQEQLAIKEELYGYTANQKYYDEALSIINNIVDAEKEANIQKGIDEQDALLLREKHYQEFVDKVDGMIQNSVETQKDANKEIVESMPSGSFGSFGSDYSSVPSGSSGSGVSGITGEPLGVKFGMTWNTYTGFLTDAVIATLDANQKIIDSAPEIAKAAAEAAQAAQQAKQDIERAAEAEIQRQNDVAAKRVELTIELLKAEGRTLEAVGIQRMQELAAMDESLRPLQQRLYYLEDEAKRTEEAAEITKRASDAAAKAAAKAAAEVAKATAEVAKATAEAAQAMKDLTTAQDASVKVWENSIQTLVSQGQAIQDFINSLGATTTTMTLRAAKNAYARDLAGAQSGDATSYGRITQSAGTLISTAERTAGSRVELARIVAGIKYELSSLQPVVDLDSNIELLKAIKEATSATATATQNLDILGIKTIFDLTQVLTLVDNSEGLPDFLKEMIVNQSGVYMLWLQAQLDSTVSDDLKRILIDGAGKYATVVDAILGDIDDESRQLAIEGTGRYTTYVDSVMGNDDLTEAMQKLALTSGNTYLTVVDAILGNDDLTDDIRQLALESGNTYLTSIDAIIGNDDLSDEIKKLSLESGNTYLTTLDSIAGNSNLTDDMRQLALTSGNTYLATLDTIVGNDDLSDEIKKLSLESGNTYLTTLDSIAGNSNLTEDQLQIALTSGNTYLTSIDAIIGDDALSDEIKKLSLESGNTYLTTLDSIIGNSNLTEDQLQIALTSGNTYLTIADAIVGNDDLSEDVKTLALESGNTYLTVVDTIMGYDNLTEDELQLALTSGNNYLTTLDAIMGNDDLSEEMKILALESGSTYLATLDMVVGSDSLSEDAKVLALESGNTYLTIVDTIMGYDGLPEDIKKLSIESGNAYLTTLDIIVGSDNLSDETKKLAFESGNTYLTTIDTIVGSGNLSDEMKTLALEAGNDYLTTVNVTVGNADLTYEQQKLALDTGNEYLTFVDTIMGYDGLPEDIKKLSIESGNAYLTTLDIIVGNDNLSDETKKLALESGNTYLTTIDTIVGSGRLSDEMKILALESGNDYLTTVNVTVGNADLTYEQQKLALGTGNEYLTLVSAAMGSDNLNDDVKKLALEAGNAYLTTVNAAIGTIDPVAQTLGLNTANTLASTVTASLGLTDPDAVSLAMQTANSIAATVTAALGSGDADALKLATEQANSFAATITAALATDATTQELAAMLTNANLTTTVDGSMTWNPNDPMKSIWNAIKDQTTLTAQNTGRYATVSTKGGSVAGQLVVTWNLYSGSGDLVSSNSSYITPQTAAETALLIDAYKPIFAKGAAFDAGNIIPFAQGDIFDNPTIFPMANGTGLMGEAGPEAIMPLTRIGGSLGVNAEGINSGLIAEVKALRAEVRELRGENKAGTLQIVKNTLKTAKILGRFDDDGIPAERVVA